MAKKLESNLKNMFLSLTFISMGMSAALGYVYLLTKDPIVAASKAAETNAIKEVVPAFDNTPEAKEVDGLVFYEATKEGTPVGYAIKTYTEKAFSGRFDLMVGLLPDGSINQIFVLNQKETPGLGTKIKDPKFKDQFLKKNPGNWKMTVKKDGGEVDAISAATISSRAFCDAVQKAYDIYMKNIGNQQSLTLPNDSTIKGE
ncbi:MAG: Electron transport complex protein RnfG [Bacteroidetes bacterium ADurb.Bin408]|nr:MAG: Electron transport complex protein RnfG [Bacteroidetes bacterium ADurb.Bin408]